MGDEMLKRALVMLMAVVTCVTLLSSCGSKKEEEPSFDLTFSDTKVECNKREGFFGDRHANFKLTASVKNTSENPVNEDNMPILSTEDGKAEVKPDLSQDKLLPGETCNITYEQECDVKSDGMPTLSFSCKLSTIGLEDAEVEINEGLKGIADKYASDDAKKEEEREADKKKKEQARKAVEDSKGKTADEGLKAAEAAGYSAYFKDSANVDVTPKVKDSSNGSDVHSAKISSVKVEDYWLFVSAEFVLDYTDPDAKKEREAEEKEKQIHEELMSFKGKTLQEAVDFSKEHKAHFYVDQYGAHDIAYYVKNMDGKEELKSRIVASVRELTDSEKYERKRESDKQASSKDNAKGSDDYTYRFDLVVVTESKPAEPAPPAAAPAAPEPAQPEPSEPEPEQPAQAPEEVQAPQSTSQLPCWVTKTGHSYHRSKSCRTLSRSKNLYEMTVEEARSQGYEPCDFCC